MRKFGMLVGNGFSRDFTDNLDINSSRPLHCFGNSKVSYDEFINYIPAIRDEVLITDPEENDFEAINQFAKKYKRNIAKKCQLRRFLGASYSLFQLESEKGDITNWKWTKWLKKNRNRVKFAVSLNYDLILEDSLKFADLKHYRVGSTDHVQGIPIIKPHGSIDFDQLESFIKVEPRETVWFNWFHLCDAGTVRTMEKNEWRNPKNPRVSADIIPPLQENFLLKANMRWVLAGYETYYHLTAKPNDIDAFVIIGHSYSEPDRPEVKYLLSRLSKNTTVFVVGSNRPSPLLIQEIRSRNLPLEIMGRDELPW